MTATLLASSFESDQIPIHQTNTKRPRGGGGGGGTVDGKTVASLILGRLARRPSAYVKKGPHFTAISLYILKGA